MQRDTQLFGALERRYEERVAEVRVLEGQLADFNLAFDKVRTSTELADIQHQFDRLRESNEHERRRLDDVFLQRAETDQRAKQVEAETEALHRRNEERLQALGESLRAQYVSLQQENSELMRDIQQKEERVQMMDDRIYALQNELKRDAYANLQKV
jgi:intraflagellar transport protein 74